MNRENIYEFEIRHYFPDSKLEDFHRARGHPLPVFVPGKIKSSLKKRTIGETYLQVYSRNKKDENKTYWAIRGEIYSKSILEIVRSIVNYAGKTKVDYIELNKVKEISEKKKSNFENILEEWNWNEGNLKFKNCLEDKEWNIPKKLCCTNYSKIQLIKKLINQVFKFIQIIYL